MKFATLLVAFLALVSFTNAFRARNHATFQTQQTWTVQSCIDNSDQFFGGVGDGKHAMSECCYEHALVDGFEWRFRNYPPHCDWFVVQCESLCEEWANSQ
jgi:hypothetical protein